MKLGGIGNCEFKDDLETLVFFFSLNRALCGANVGVSRVANLTLSRAAN